MKTSCWIVVCLVVGVTWLLGTPVTTAAHLTETLALLQAPDWTVRRDAVVLLRTLGPTVRDNPEITAALVELAQSEELLPAWHAFLALNSIYQGALQEIYPAGVRKDIFTSIETLHINSSAIVRRLSAQKLLALVDEPTVRSIILAARDTDREIVQRAVHALGVLAPEYPAAYRQLFIMLSEADPRTAAVARSYFPADPREYLDLIVRELTNPDMQIQAAARRLLETQAPGYLAATTASTSRLEDEFSVEKRYDAVSNTWYFLTRISHKNKYGEIIPLKHAHAIQPAGETVREFAVRTQSVLAFNASTATTDANGVLKPTGIQIIDGVIVQDLPRKAYTLAIMADNRLVAYPPGTTAAVILADGAVNALSGFVPLIIDGEPVSDDVLNLIANSAEKHPRQVIAQFDNLDILFLSCGGRGYNGDGMTTHDLIRVLLPLGVRFAYNLDGGGSVSTVVRGELITPKIDSGGTMERRRPNFLYFQ